ncbi:MAG: hypoxanthine phosphoribosyltransferase [Planctomycetaceae bacterium]|nr:MAG: hypoxanthine phosphoribosyltransferase [Planctomycetaceae bacterium]
MRTLITAEQIAERVDQLAAQITATYVGLPLTVVGVLHGSIVLMADLMRRIATPHQIGFIRASSYRGATTRGGTLDIDVSGLPNINQRHVLLVDDILDTGRTLHALLFALADLRPVSLRSAVLLWKQGRQEVSLTPDFHAFQIPDVFVVGYGLDYNGDYRHLPQIAVLEPSDLGNL